MRERLYTGVLNDINRNNMNARILFGLQFASLITMLGTAETLFENTLHTILFISAFVLFARCSIYISKNEKRLTEE